MRRRPKSTGRERGLFARWLTPAEMSGEQWRHEGGLLLGRRGGRLIGWNDDRHVMTIAGSRAGKGVSLIIPNLLLYEGSALVIDPKGENARITARRRGKGTQTRRARPGCLCARSLRRERQAPPRPSIRWPSSIRLRRI